MLYTIQNEQVTAQISRTGGELQSLQDNEGTEYLWQGNAKYWSGRSPVLFPYVGRLTDQRYSFQGRIYHMDIHGFAKNSEFALSQYTSDTLRLQLQDTASTRQMYPFSFVFEILYHINRNRLEITYSVVNKDTKTMYFGLGGHPGFRVPLEEGISFEDYYLEFQHYCQPVLIDLSEACYVTGNTSYYPLQNNRQILLRHSLFDNDVLVLQEVAPQATLKSDLGQKQVCISFNQMPYLGLWHWPKTDAPYICIEPWTSLPSRQGIVEDISLQSNLIALKASSIYTNQWSIEIS